jgi:hypothetical protein
MASSDAKMDDSDTGSVLTDALATETLEVRSMVPAEFQQPVTTRQRVTGCGVCETRDVCILYSRFQGQLDLLSLFPPLNESEDAIWPARPMGLAGQLVECQKPNW